MMIPEFIRFYGYTVSQVMDEAAITFFALMNSMYRLQGKESLNQLSVQSAAFQGGSGATQIIEDLKKQAKGLHGIVEEVRTVKNIGKQ